MKKNKQQYDHMAGCRALRARDDDDDDDDDDDGGGGGGGRITLVDSTVDASCAHQNPRSGAFVYI